MRPSKLPRSLTIDECSRLLAACHDPETYALVDFLWATGARRAEALGLRWQDIDFEENTARVTGKGQKQRLVLFGQATRESLETWRRAAQDRNGSSCPSERQGEHVWGLSRQGYDKRLHAAGRRAGLTIHFHMLRHSFATQCHENGMDIRVLGELMGHVRCDTTAIYLDVSRATIMERGQLMADCLAAARDRGPTRKALRRTDQGLVWR